MYDLSEEEIQELTVLVDEITNFKGEWIDAEKSTLAYACTDDIVDKAMDFLYNKKLIIAFDWASWVEGKDFFNNDDPNKYDNLDREFILKLLSAIARNDRFCTGAWGSIFESGEAQNLFRKLLETYKG